MITVLSFYTENLKDIGILNSIKWKVYCNNYNYNWICLTPSNIEYHPFWKKIHYITQELNSTDNDLLWTDIDVVIKIPKYELNNLLNLSNRDIFISSDPWGLCAGFMMIRNTKWSRNFYNQLLVLGDLNEDLQKSLYINWLGDQNTIKYLYDGFFSVRSHFFLLDQNIVSCPKTLNPIAPFHHYWANGNDVYKKEMILYFKIIFR